jgi:uncharacterized protein DUF3891
LIFRTQFEPRESQGEISPAFDAIAEIQHAAAASDWFVTQPDHARISGQLAAALNRGKIPDLNDSAVQAIGMHDIGWMPLDGDVRTPREPQALESGVAVSFVNSEPERFLPAWLGSIQAAQSTGPLGGLLVSAHFARLTYPYLDSGRGTLEQRLMVEQFLERETAREKRLAPKTGLSDEQIEALVDVLRFCDLASLYWCANPDRAVEMPMQIAGTSVQLSHENGGYRLSPSLLDAALDLEIPCVRFTQGQFERGSVRVTVH